MHRKLLAATVLVAFSTVASGAAPGAGQATSFDPMVVTATRFGQVAIDTLAPVVVVTRADIERLQAQSVLELLRGLPGVALANAGGLGQQTSLFLRGTNSSHTLVLVDGVRIGSVGAGLAALEQIPVDQIERIELVRGPRSSLYGADAIGGVIQIFTRHAEAGAGWVPSFSLSGGSHNTWDSHAGVSLGGKHGWLSANVGAQYTRGINSCRLGAGTVFAGCFANEPDDDGYRAYSGTLNGGWRWDSGVELVANFLRSTSFVEYDGSFQNYSRHGQQVLGASLSWPVSARWSMAFNAGQSRDKATNYLGRSYTGYGDSRRDQASWLNTFVLAEGQHLAAGADYAREAVDSDTAYLNTRRDNSAVFAYYQGRFGANELQISARRDHNQQFGDHGTGALAWGYHFADGLVLSAAYATSFHAPTFNDLYWPAFPGFPPSADPHLKPESARNVELDLASRHATWYWQLSAYRTTIDDLIALDANFTPGNISRAVIHGLEGQVGGQVQDWTWAGYLTVQKPENRDGGANDGNLLPRRFERSLRVDLDRRFGAFSVGATAASFNARYDDIANTHRLGGYATLDIRGSWQFAAHWQLEARIANALDKDYATVYYYNQPGRHGMLTLRYRP